jgi:histidyl-tRNA synthetase
VLITLDKLDKLSVAEVSAELAGRGLSHDVAASLVGALTAGSVEQVRETLKASEEGAAGIGEVDELLSLLAGQVPADRVVFTPRLVRGLSYYTGPIWEIVADGIPGSLAGGGRYDHLIEQLGGPDVPATGGALGVERILMSLADQDRAHSRLDVAVTVMDERYAARSFSFAAAARAAGLRASVYLGSSGKLGSQLKWASRTGARWTLIYGSAEDEAGTVTVRDMSSGEQAAVPVSELTSYLASLADAAGLP